MSVWTAEEVELESPAYAGLAAEPGASAFASAAWARILDAGLGFRSRALLFRHEGEPRGAVRLHVRRFGPLRIAWSGLPYGSALGELPPAPELATLLRDGARRLGIARLRLFEAPGAPYPNLGARITADSTHLLRLDATDPERLWNGFRREIRRDVRKAERSAVEVVERADAAAADSFYALYLESMERNRAAPKYSREFVRRVVARDPGAPGSALLLARRQGEEIAGMLLVDSPEGSHYLLGGSRTAGLRWLPNDLLIWRALERSLALGHRGFDFLPSGPGDVALQRFKSKWGAETVPVATHDLVYRKAADAAWRFALAASRWRPLRKAITGARRGGGG